MLQKPINLLALIFACAPTLAAPIAGAEFISDKMIVDIAQATLEKGGHNSSEKILLERRSVEVKKWLTSVGGDNWYRNYLKNFGAPMSPQKLTQATLIGLQDNKLNYYYIRGVPVSPDSMTVLPCNDPNFDENPTLKGFCALAYWNAFIAFNHTNSLLNFRKWANWFLNNQVDGKWAWGIDLPSRNQKAPWISGLTQSLGISILLREYQLSQDTRFLEAATKALAWMGRPITEGGIAYKMTSGTWFEEYPDASNPSHVLNGHMWALFGIYDYYRVTRDQTAKKLFNLGIAALLSEIHKYDVGYWSVYAQTNRVDVVTGAYQQFIIEQLLVLHQITGKARLRQYSEKWALSLNTDHLFIHIAAKDFLKANTENNK